MKIAYNGANDSFATMVTTQNRLDTIKSGRIVP